MVQRKQNLVARVLDGAIAALSPGWAAQRARGRRTLDLERALLSATKDHRPLKLRYGGAKQDRLENFGSSGSADGDLLPDLRILRERSRALVRDDGHAAAAVRVLVDNVVGNGIRPQAAARPETTGMSQQQCDDWNGQAEEIFDAWATDQADANQIDTFDDLTRLVYRTRVIDGETIVHRVTRGEGVIRTAYELIDSDRLQDPFTPLTVNHTRHGVEIGPNGQPVAYWITPRHPEDYRFLTAGGNWANNQPERVDRWRAGVANILHVYRRDRPGQSRGVPTLAPVLSLFGHLHDYLFSEVVAAQTNAKIALFIRRPLDPTQNPYAKLDDPKGDGTGQQRWLEQFEAGTIEYLNPGEEIAPYLPNRPGTTFDPFVMRILRAICAALGLPLELVTKDFGSMNYSSARVALLEARRGFENEQAALIASWLDPVWKTVISEAMLAGALPITGRSLVNPRAFLAVRWIRGSWGWVDPTKEIQAAADAVDANLSTPDIEAARAGLDVEDILNARARYFVRAREIEQANQLDPGTLTRRPTAAVAAPGAAADQNADPASAGSQKP